MINNSFTNLDCPYPQWSFNHAHGVLGIYMSGSYSYINNEKIATLKNNTFINCTCITGGALGIVGY